jgi:hypothetical protein
MLSVDKALSIFTDSRNKGKAVDIEEFKEQMSVDDYAEFLELISFTTLLIETDSYSQYDKIFEKLDIYKEEIFNLPSVANFRTTGGKATKDAIDKIDKIFEEEFGDE